MPEPTTIDAPSDALFTQLARTRSNSLAAARKLAEQAGRRSLSLLEEQELDGLLSDAEAAQRRMSQLVPPPVRVKSEPLTYQRGGPHSFIFDVLSKHEGKSGKDPGAEERLERHRREMDVELDRRERAAEREFAQRMDWFAGSYEKRTNPNTTAGQGGYLAPPLWIVEAYASIPRAGRPLANLLPSVPLPRGVHTVNVPKITAGPRVAAQVADGSAGNTADITDSSCTSPITTIEGHSDVSQQLLDQVPLPGLDGIIFADLLRDYDEKLETQLVNGTASNGQLRGLLNVSGTTSVSYTDASPTVPELFSPLGQAAAQLTINRLAPPTCWLMHGRRWFWIASALDNQSRPVMPPGEGEFAEVEYDLMVDQAMPVGPLLGLPVFLDQTIPTTAGGGTEDKIIATRPTDGILFERPPMLRVLTEPLSGTMQARLQLIGFAAVILDRYPTSTAIIGGTGLAAVTGFGA